MNIKKNLVRNISPHMPAAFSKATIFRLNSFGSIENSVLFTDISYADNDFQADLNRLPFKDFMVLIPIEVEEKLTGVVSNLKGGRVLFRVMDKKDVLIIVVYFRSMIASQFIPILIVDLNKSDHKVVSQVSVDEQIFGGDNLNKYLICILSCIKEIQSYELKIKYSPKGFKLSKISPSERSKHMVYTVDLSKRLKYESESNFNTKRKHKSPCEHKRIGHVRRYKSGKEVWVEDTIVRKGTSSECKENTYTKS